MRRTKARHQGPGVRFPFACPVTCCRTENWAGKRTPGAGQLITRCCRLTGKAFARSIRSRSAPVGTSTPFQFIARGSVVSTLPTSPAVFAPRAAGRFDFFLFREEALAVPVGSARAAAGLEGADGNADMSPSIRAKPLPTENGFSTIGRSPVVWLVVARRLRVCPSGPLRGAISFHSIRFTTG